MAPASKPLGETVSLTVPQAQSAGWHSPQASATGPRGDSLMTRRIRPPLGGSATQVRNQSGEGGMAEAASGTAASARTATARAARPRPNDVRMPAFYDARSLTLPPDAWYAPQAEAGPQGPHRMPAGDPVLLDQRGPLRRLRFFVSQPESLS